MNKIKLIDDNFFYSLQIQDKFEDPPEPLTPVRLGNLKTVRELEERLSVARNPQARELFRILRNPHFRVSSGHHQPTFNFNVSFNSVLVINLLTRQSG